MSLGNRGGRPRKPVEMHLAAGTYRKHRHEKYLPQTNGVPKRKRGDAKPVEAIEVDADREYWIEPEGEQSRRFCEILRNSPIGAAIEATDSAALTLISELWVLLNISVDEAMKNPLDPSARAAVLGYTGAFDKLCARFGLTPADRQRLQMPTAATATGVAKRNRSPAAAYFAAKDASDLEFERDTEAHT